MFFTSSIAVIFFVAAASLVGAQTLPGCFLSMGDWGSVNKHVASMGDYMGAIIDNPTSVGCSSISFVLALGDNFYPNGVSSVTDPQWDNMFVAQFRGREANK